MTFRIMPRQVNSRPNEQHTRYGFFINNHPMGDPDHGGKYLASWDDLDTAFAAAYCLGIDPHLVAGLGFVPYIEPKDEDWRSTFDDPPDWKDVGKWVELQNNGDPIERWRGELEADAWFNGEDEIPICKVAEKSIYDFEQWRVIHHEHRRHPSRDNF